MATDIKNTDLEQVAQEMALFAKEELHYLGAAVINLVTVLSRETGEVAGISAEYATRLSRKPEPEKRGSSDKGTDYLAMAHGKADKRLRNELGMDTGFPLVRRGEDEATGDSVKWLSDGLLVIAAFSGAPTPEQDQIVTDWGINRIESIK